MQPRIDMRSAVGRARSGLLGFEALATTNSVPRELLRVETAGRRQARVAHSRAHLIV